MIVIYIFIKLRKATLSVALAEIVLLTLYVHIKFI